MSAPALPLFRSSSSEDPSADLYSHVPSGWFALASSRELARGAVLTRRLAGRDVVLFRTEAGQAHATEPYCPHMGAHLGHGGKVEGDTLRCPFHAFRFDGSGKCVATPYGSPPPKARLSPYPLHEHHDAIFVWLGSAGEAPTFRIPDVDTEGWFTVADHVVEMRGHPQETNENSVDTGHLNVVHGYRDVKVLEPLRFDGASLFVTYGMLRPSIPGLSIPGPLGMIPAEFAINVHGLGYSRVEVSVPPLGMRSRHFVFATPTDRERLRLHMGFSLQKGSLRMPGIGPLTRAAIERAVMRLGIRVFAHDVLQDYDIWNHKRYVHPPQLAVGDGPIGAYRRWAKQFYPSVTRAEPDPIA